jgi:hypothetical protein
MFSSHLRLDDLVAEAPHLLDPDLDGHGRAALLSWRRILVVATPAREHCSLEILAPGIDAHPQGPRIGLPQIPFCDRLPWPRWREATAAHPYLPARIHRAFEAACGAPAQARLRLARLLAYAHNRAAGRDGEATISLEGPETEERRHLRRLTRDLRTSTRRALFRGAHLTLCAPTSINPLPWEGAAHRRMADAAALARLLRGERLPPLPGDPR